MKFVSILAAAIALGGCSMGGFKSSLVKFWWAALGADTRIQDLAIKAGECDISIGRFRSDKSKAAGTITEGAVKGAIEGLKSGL